MYKYTPQEIADMTPAQQMMMLDLSGQQTSDTLRFDTMSDYEDWTNEQ